MPKTIIGVMGAGEHATPLDLQNAYELGQRIAEAGWIVLSGGRNVGVMDAVSRGAKSRDGLTIGILPRINSAMSDAIDIPIITDMGNARNNINVLSSHAIVACGMGAGTASEVALAIKARKRVILITEDLQAREFFRSLNPNLVSIAETAAIALEQLKVILSTQK
ncbi:cytochrome P450 [Leptolyngbya boryana NIES-2135]|uniref:Cytochrome P450 n=1 Tax=Leptolyngbya boryana NIES-2135 TaxID=1973484 RepID=A0A1Z4JMG4_LEPBY|nr:MULTISPECIES: LOG family protein [Leptolyngbya]BAY57890.1 cytochrome P450 [Leptolyngbya boryana NIES-2135]MBD2367336.1 LOG family protein [Leptolyngbya sp. FACHB-161]MBD2373860.1 LOG family protein [Leptolyngbya sp. FACHB-238]MBD2398340.1 LOG family protein [Leptolyngbya sp. FACHB-239]MBD2404163.1 LOG family protein [Leptolyngbya sp. FACHB-402]